jgi:hypothetical protein
MLDGMVCSGCDVRVVCHVMSVMVYERMHMHGEREQAVDDCCRRPAGAVQES